MCSISIVHYVVLAILYPQFGCFSIDDSVFRSSQLYMHEVYSNKLCMHSPLNTKTRE